MLRPPPLRPGARVAVVAPCGPFAREPFERGLARLRSRFSVSSAPAHGQHRFFAAPDAARAAELQAAIDGDNDAIVVARGGTGLLRIVGQLDYRALLERPRWLIGFSDVTALHGELWRRGLRSLHAPNVTGLGALDDGAAETMLDALTTPRASFPVQFERSGSAEGPLVGGNLTVLHAAHAAGRLRLPSGAVLFLEDVGEAPYRLDRALTTLLRTGALDAVSAVVLGTFTSCAPGPLGVEALDAVVDALRDLRIPLAVGLPVGHGEPNEPLELGASATLQHGRLELR